MKRETEKRAALLLTISGLALVLVACGRASEEDILSAIGITPTATHSPEEIAASTATASAQQTVEAASTGSPAVDVAALGDVTRGRGTFGTWCVNCHTPGGGGPGPDILVAGSAGASITLDSLTALLREGENHPPGPYQSFSISDRAIGDMAAYILAEASS